MTVERLLSEFNKIIDARIRRYVSSHLETVYFGTVSSAAGSGAAYVDLGFKTVSAKNMTGADVAAGDKVLVKVPWDTFNNAYIDKKF